MSDETDSGLSSIISEGVVWQPPAETITDRHVAIAIEVLKAYINGTLRTDLCDELDEAIEEAFYAQMETPQGDEGWGYEGW